MAGIAAFMLFCVVWGWFLPFSAGFATFCLARLGQPPCFLWFRVVWGWSRLA